MLFAWNVWHVFRARVTSVNFFWLLQLSPRQTIIPSFILWQGSIEDLFERSDWFFLCRDFAIRTFSTEMAIRRVFSQNTANLKHLSMFKSNFTKYLLTSFSRAVLGNFGLTSGQYSSAQPLCSVGKRLVVFFSLFCVALHLQLLRLENTNKRAYKHTALFSSAQLKSGINFDKSTAEARHLNQN